MNHPETCHEPGHVAGCPGKAGGDHELASHDDCVPTAHGVGCIYGATDCPATLAEVWCDRCDQPSERITVTVHGPQTLCHEHAAMLAYKLTSSAWVAR